ncbi:TPA: class A beta-lactamase, partial [Salmonella enterica]|nr:class A beta-lactamase [Salmonella enterica]
ASSLTDSLRSVVRLRRAVSAHSKAVIRLSTESGDKAGKNM